MRQDPAKLDVTVSRIEREAVRLDELVGQLLTLSRLDTDRRDTPREPVDLIDLASAIADDARFEAHALGRDLRFEGRGEAEALIWGRACSACLRERDPQCGEIPADGTFVEVSALADGDVFRLRVGIAARGARR
ncbi:hypothetical protein [Zoogloea sp.]|uniref:hypothetical protein n=1 Tax=Zoogloea sp. TaxID=49181 RepID=UPI0025D3B54D|nr:hypothetical protein [Zoogloea sp.]